MIFFTFKRNFFHLIWVRIRKVYAFKTKSIAQGPDQEFSLFHLNWLPLVGFQTSSPYLSTTWKSIQYPKTACWSSDKNSASAKFPICWHLWTANLTPSWNSSQIFKLRHTLPPELCTNTSSQYYVPLAQLQPAVHNHSRADHISESWKTY